MRNVCLLAMLALAAVAQTPDPVFSAIRENHLAGLKELLRQKTNATTADTRGVTPLMYAAQVGSVEAMRLLIEQGADVNAQND